MILRFILDFSSTFFLPILFSNLAIPLCLHGFRLRLSRSVSSITFTLGFFFPSTNHTSRALQYPPPPPPFFFPRKPYFSCSLGVLLFPSCYFLLGLVEYYLKLPHQFTHLLFIPKSIPLSTAPKPALLFPLRVPPVLLSPNFQIHPFGLSCSPSVHPTPPHTTLRLPLYPKCSPLSPTMTTSDRGASDFPCLLLLCTSPYIIRLGPWGGERWEENHRSVSGAPMMQPSPLTSLPAPLHPTQSQGEEGSAREVFSQVRQSIVLGFTQGSYQAKTDF